MDIGAQISQACGRGINDRFVEAGILKVDLSQIDGKIKILFDAFDQSWKQHPPADQNDPFVDF